MSGEYRDEQNIEIEATDNAELAKRHGLTQYDKASGQWRKPTAPDAGQRDSGAYNAEISQLREQLAQQEQHSAELAAALAERHEQDEAKAKADAEAAEADKAKAKPRNAGPNR